MQIAALGERTSSGQLTGTGHCHCTKATLFFTTVLPKTRREGGRGKGRRSGLDFRTDFSSYRYMDASNKPNFVQWQCLQMFLFSNKDNRQNYLSIYQQRQQRQSRGNFKFGCLYLVPGTWYLVYIPGTWYKPRYSVRRRYRPTFYTTK